MNDLGFTEVTIPALVGRANGSVTGKYIHALDNAVIMARTTSRVCSTGWNSGNEPAFLLWFAHA